MTKAAQLLIIIIFFSCTGCKSLNIPVYFENTSQEPIDIEVLRPGDTIIDQSIKKVLVFIKPGLVTNIIFSSDNPGIQNNLQFKELPEHEFYSMADLLSTSPRFTIMQAGDSIQNPDGKSYSLDELAAICRKAQVDGCIYLEKQELILNDSKNYDSENPGTDSRDGLIMLISKYEFYGLNDNSAFAREVKTGVEFQSKDDDHGSKFQLSDDLESLVEDYAAENGEKFAGWIAPEWQRDTRYYYLKGNSELESVKDLIKASRWDEVYSIWRRNMSSENMQVAKHSMYNSIISFEMQGKLDSAVLITNEAYKRFKSEELVDYGLILMDRIREEGMVEKQLGLPDPQQ